MERLRHHRQRQIPSYVLPGTPRNEAAPEEPSPGPAAIQLIWGPIADRLAAEGMTVEEVRGLVERPLNIPRQAAALVNGYPARPTQRLTAGDTLEFARRAGEKGSSDV